MTTGASVDGRALARTGAVTLDSNAVSACGGVAGTTPTLGKAFSPANVLTAGGVSTLTITLSNRDVAVATLTAPLVDTLPSGVVIAATPNVSTTCGGVGAPVAVAGASTVTLPAGRTIPANGSCTLTVDVTATVDGPHVNVLPAGALVTATGTNAAAAGAILTVGPLGRRFHPHAVRVGDDHAGRSLGPVRRGKDSSARDVVGDRVVWTCGKPDERFSASG